MLETEDGEFSDFLMREIHKTIGNFIHEQVWVLFATQEVSNTSFFLQLAASFRSLREPLTNSMCAHTLQTNRRLRSNRYQCSIECKRSTFQCCIWAVNVAEWSTTPARRRLTSTVCSRPNRFKTCLLRKTCCPSLAPKCRPSKNTSSSLSPLTFSLRTSSAGLLSPILITE